MPDLPMFSATFNSESDTSAFAVALGSVLESGDTVLLEGEIGAGKTFFARALIQSLQAREGRIEDVPSPTYTLVQVYDGRAGEIWHADLYRVSGPAECVELGLDEAFASEICLVEWPGVLGDLAPPCALWLRFETTERPGERHLTARSKDPRWVDRLRAFNRWGSAALAG